VPFCGQSRAISPLLPSYFVLSDRLLGIENGVDPKFVQSAIYSGNTWGLTWKFPGIFHNGGDTPAIVKDVVDILAMWSDIESAYQSLSSEDKARIETEVEPLGRDVQFRGFDGNNESEHFGIALFLVNDLERFSELKGRDLNSHMPSLGMYRRMLATYTPLRSSLSYSPLTPSQLIQILKEQIHPSRRQ
jgi:uncharacterized protein YfbU (UPF0304 family)